MPNGSIYSEFYSYLTESWSTLFVKKDGDTLIPQKFVENEKERFFISDYLQNQSDLSQLRKMIYNGAIINDVTYLDDSSNVHDKLTFFVLSNLCMIFWLLEDNSNPISGESSPDFLKDIKKISEGLRNSNSELIINSLIQIFKIINDLDSIEKPNLYESNSIITKLTTKRKNFIFDDIHKKSFINTELNKINLFDDPYDVFRLINVHNNLIDPIIFNIYDYLEKNKISSIIGIERSGLPLASLIAYTFDIPLHILRTVPLIKLLPNELLSDRAAIIDDISITGTNLRLAKDYIKENTNVKNLKTIVITKDSTVKNVDKFFFERRDFSDKYVYKRNLKIFEPLFEQEPLNYDLKTEIRNRCTKNNYWFSEYAYGKGIFRSICDELIQRIKNKKIQDNCIIISTSIFGLPFASVISYKLKRPLFLFSRRPNMILDFSQKEILKKNLINGHLVFIDDIFISGATQETAEQKIKSEVSDEMKFDVNKIVITFLGTNNPENLDYIVGKSDLEFADVNGGLKFPTPT